MALPEIPAEHLERIHTCLGPGKGNEYAIRHLPSGIMVGGVKPSHVKISEFEQQLFTEFMERLKAAGLGTGTPRSEKNAHE